MSLIIRNAKLINNEELVDIYIEDGVFKEIDSKIQKEADKEIDAQGFLVSPPLIDSHIHIDAALSAYTLEENISGSLEESIQLWGKMKNDINQEVYFSRMVKVIEWLISQGVQYVRAHTDASEKNNFFIQLLQQLKIEYESLIDIQIVAFPQDGIYTSTSNYGAFLAAVESGVDVIGGLPQAEHNNSDGDASLKLIFDLAKKHQLMIDIHADETNDPQSIFTEKIAQLTLDYGLEGKVAISHATAMHEYEEAYIKTLYPLLKKSQVSIVTNPFSNALLQNRHRPYPRSRGIARVDELLNEEINVSIGNDNVIDPFGPLGKANILQAALFLAYYGQLSNRHQLHQLYEMITTKAAKTLQIDKYGININHPANCIILHAKNREEALRLTSPTLYSIRHGKVISETMPQDSKIYYPYKTKNINFFKEV